MDRPTQVSCRADRGFYWRTCPYRHAHMCPTISNGRLSPAITVTRCRASITEWLQAPELLLSGVRVVLVSPKTPANIGAVLRAAENFEVHDVCIVDPRCDPRCQEVEIVSCSSAVFGSMWVAPTLRDALKDVAGSVGFTRRAGAGRVTHPSLSSLLSLFPGILPPLQQPLEQPEQQLQLQPSLGDGNFITHTSSSSLSSSSSSNGSGGRLGSGNGVASADSRLALVFGREESGLLEGELLLCSHACAIPTGRSQPSLNLSHAVAVVLAQLFELRAHQLGGPDLCEAEHARFVRRRALAPADQGQLEALLERWAALLEGAGISAMESTGGGHKGAHGRRRKVMGHLRSLLLRGKANAVEVRALHGLAKELERRLGGESDPDSRSGKGGAGGS